MIQMLSVCRFLCAFLLWYDVFDNFGRHTDNDGVWRHVVNNEGIRSDNRVIADRDRTEDCGTYTDEHIVADYRNLIVVAASADRNAVSNPAVFADDDSPMNNNSHTPIIEVGIAADGRRIWNGSCKCKPHEVVDDSRQEWHFPSIKCV